MRFLRLFLCASPAAGVRKWKNPAPEKIDLLRSGVFL